MLTITSDLTVIGAGYAGICTAISAARHGLKVILVNDRDVAGGNASSEHRVSICGGATGNSSYYSREAGISDEIKLTIFHRNPRHVNKQDYHLTDMALLEMIQNERNILYYPGTCVYDCECEGNTITKVYAFKAKTQKDFEFVSPLYCDASGDGILAYKAGAKYRIGRESRYEFGESLAPETADSHVMGSSILFTVRREEEPVKFYKPVMAYDFIRDGILPYFDRPSTGRELPQNGGPYNGTWWIEYGGLSDTISDANEIDLELKRLVYSYWDYIKNSGNYPEADNLTIDWIAPFSSKRESRRFIGEYIMTQNDIQCSQDFEDAVSTGGWCLDIHDVGGIYGEENASAFGEVKSMYNIPLSIMYSVNVSNLFLSGRIISCTHVALGSLRVMQTLGAMGQAVGTAAVLCKKYGCTPEKVRKDHITELQDMLQRDGQYIMGRKEDCGLAAQATISASSEMKFESTRTDCEIRLNRGIVWIMPILKPHVSTIDFGVKNTSSSPVICQYNIFGEETIKNYRPGKLLAERSIEIPGNFEGYIKFLIDVDTEDNKIFIEFKKNNYLSLLCSEMRLTGAPAFFDDGKRLVQNGKVCSINFKNAVGSDGMYAATNVINGYSRPYGRPNCWISDGNKNQWIELKFNEPKDIQEIQLYFNPQYETECFQKPIEQLITEYKVHIKTDTGIVERWIKDNYLGINKINVSASNVTSIRIYFLANNGAPNFEVFTIKVF